MSVGNDRNHLVAMSSTDVGTVAATRDDDADSFKALNN